MKDRGFMLVLVGLGLIIVWLCGFISNVDMDKDRFTPVLAVPLVAGAVAVVGGLCIVAYAEVCGG